MRCNKIQITRARWITSPIEALDFFIFFNIVYGKWIYTLINKLNAIFSYDNNMIIRNKLGIRYFFYF